jgi:hypothetical protein
VSTGRRLLAASLVATAALVPPAAAAPAAAPGATAARTLNGTFRIGAGSYFRMRFPTGKGYFRNPDSSSRDKTVTLLRAGRSGGLASGTYQPPPRKAFDRRGNSRASSIIKPQAFAGVRFGLATLARDPQSRNGAPRPAFSLVGRRIFGQTTALTAAWNKVYFNQGAPKPGSSGAIAIGSYDPASRRYVLTWTSKIRGGPFNGFTGVWRLTGTFAPR